MSDLERRVLAIEEALGYALAAIKQLQERKIWSLEAQHAAFEQRVRASKRGVPEAT